MPSELPHPLWADGPMESRRAYALCRGQLWRWASVGGRATGAHSWGSRVPRMALATCAGTQAAPKEFIVKPPHLGPLNLASPPLSVDVGTGLDVAAREMALHHVGSLVVTVEGRPSGLVTDRDVALAALQRSESSLPLLKSVMSKPLLTLPETCTLEEAVDTLAHHCVRRVALVSSEGALCSVLSADSLLIHLGGLMGDIRSGLQREFQEERDHEPNPSTATGAE